MSKTESLAAIGRPRGKTAVSHAAVLDAVYDLLKETSARDLTMDAIARRAKVGKPTLYKWWQSKAALVTAMFEERLKWRNRGSGSSHGRKNPTGEDEPSDQ